MYEPVQCMHNKRRPSFTGIRDHDVSIIAHGQCGRMHVAGLFFIGAGAGQHAITFACLLIMDDKPRPKKDEAAAKDRKPAVPATTSVAAPRPERAAPAAPAAVSAPAASTAAVQQPVPSSPLLDPAPQPSPTPLAATTTPQLSQSLVEEEPLKLVRQVQPEMTRQIAAADIKQGSVTAKFMVNADGSVGDAQIVTSTNRVLNSPVLAALRQWRYEPRKEPREAQVEFAFDFSK
jgi:TonB family protein